MKSPNAGAVAVQPPLVLPPGGPPPGGQPPGVKAPPASTSGTSTDVALLAPEDIPASRVEATVPASELTPPSQDVRFWTLANPQGLTWQSQEQTTDGDWIVLRGQVDVRSGAERIQADELRLNLKTHEVKGEGNVVLDREDARLTGSRLEYDLDTNTGLVFDALGYTNGELSFTAKVAEQVAPQKFVLHGASFTSCEQPKPIWEIKASKAVVHVDHFVYLWNPRVLFKKVPAYYLPWVAFPIKQERTTGFMVPAISTSSTKGTSISEDFFWAINRSVDLTLGGEYWSKYGWRQDTEARWFLKGMPEYGFLKGAYLHVNNPGREVPPKAERYDVTWEHRQKLGGWDLTATGEIGSDQQVNADPLAFRSNTSQLALRTLEPVFNQKFTFQRHWGKHSLNLSAENDEREQTLLNGAVPAPTPAAVTPPDVLKGTQTTINRRLPVAEYRASGLQLFGKKWLTMSMEGSAGSFQRITRDKYHYDLSTGSYSFASDMLNHQYQRADFYPQFSFPLGTSFLQVVPRVDVRGTWWSRREVDANPLTPTVVDALVTMPPLVPDDPSNVTSETISHGMRQGADTSTFLWGWDSGVKIEGPDFTRIYKAGALPGQKKWQHLIEPSIDYSYAPALGFMPIIQGDQLQFHYQQRFKTTSGTTVTGGETSKATLRLVNTLRTKRVVPVGSTEESARDWLIWTLSSDYDFEKPSQSFTFPFTPPPPLPAPQGRLEENHFNNVQSDVNFKPTEDVHFAVRNTYDVLQDDITQSSLTGGLDGAWGYSDISYTSARDRNTLKPNNTEVSLTGENWFYKEGRIRLGYDLTRKIDEPPLFGTTAPSTPWIYRRFIVSYYNQCVGLSLSWEDNATRSLRRERQWTLTVSLKELGNYLRYRRRDTPR